LLQIWSKSGEADETCLAPTHNPKYGHYFTVTPLTRRLPPWIVNAHHRHINDRASITTGKSWSAATQHKYGSQTHQQTQASPHDSFHDSLQSIRFNGKNSKPTPPQQIAGARVGS
jgi:hypothetical protein